jgi:predicted transcriptional regulator
MTTRVVTTHLPAELARRLDGLAGQLERPRGWLVKEAVETYVALAEERQRETQAALDEVTAGLAVDHAEVEAWAAAPKATRRRRKQAG